MTGSDKVEAGRPETLVDAVIQLSDNTVALTDRLTVSDRQHRRTRMLTWAVLFILVAVGGVFYNSIEGNKANAVQGCENANESRAANLQLWTTVLGTIQERNPESTWVGTLLDWVAVLYQPHDCDDLSRVYKVPPPPVLVTS